MNIRIVHTALPLHPAEMLRVPVVPGCGMSVIALMAEAISTGEAV